MKLSIIDDKKSNLFDLRKELQNTFTLPSLQNRLDEAERNGQPAFHDFTDPDMMKWFLYERRHLNQENDRTK